MSSKFNQLYAYFLICREGFTRSLYSFVSCSETRLFGTLVILMVRSFAGISTNSSFDLFFFSLDPRTFFDEQDDSRDEKTDKKGNASDVDDNRPEESAEIEMREVVAAEEHDATQHHGQCRSKYVEGFLKVVREHSHFEGHD